MNRERSLTAGMVASSPAVHTHYAVNAACADHSARRSSWRSVERLVGLADICESALNLVCLPRTLPAAVLDEARALAEEQPGERRITTVADALRIDGLLPAAAGALRSDVTHLADVYATLTGAVSLGLRLHVLRGAMCPRFHTDRVGLRLICTYVGAGTEWLDDADVRRERLGHRADGLSDETSGAVCGPVQRMPAGAIGLLKGDAWPGHDGRGIVHRSPAASADAARVVLTIDALG